ncbi:MAG: heparinase II/III family protein [Spirochaetaceae bacterium]|nr:heparinase II/III family protein [Spirochaetaceae bacterium]
MSAPVEHPLGYHRYQPLLVDSETLQRARRRTRTASFQAAWRRLTRETDALLTLDLQPPDEPAGYYHDYFCPHHAIELHFDPGQPRNHRCPVDGQLLAGRRFDAAWRFGANLLLGRAAVLLALRWRLSGDARCLRRAAAILTGYARRYPHYPVGSVRSAAGDGRGRATYQSLDEAHLTVRLARCYDLVAADLDDVNRGMVERDLFGIAIAHLDENRFRRVHNIECWHIAALTAAATVTGNDAIRDQAVHGEFGFHHQIEAGTCRDGMWWEGSSSYHYYTVAALLTTAAFLRARDAGWQAPNRFAAMLTAPLTLVLPDGRMPASNDCWASSSLWGEVCHGVPPAAALYEMAGGWWPQPAYQDLLAAIYRHGERNSEEALLHGPDRVARDGGGAERGLFRPRSDVLPHSGFAMVRSEDPLDRQSLVLLKHGPHGGSHGHPDKLAITLYARGAPAATDLGSQGYGIGLHRQWYRQTVSHNTVMVSGRSQPAATGTLCHFASPRAGGAADRRPPPSSRAGGVPRIPATVAEAGVRWSGISSGVYDGVTMRRAIAWRDPYFVDWFHVRCPARRRIDWLLHVHGTLRELHGAALNDRAPVILPRGPGWRHIARRRSVSTAGGGGSVEVHWSLRGGVLQVLFPDERGTALAVGEAPSNPASERLHSLIRTRYARATTFLAVIHPCARPGHLAAAVHGGAHDTVTLEVVVDGRKDRWRLAGADPGRTPAMMPLP